MSDLSQPFHPASRGIPVSGRASTDQLHGALHPIASVADGLASLGRSLAAAEPLDPAAARAAVVTGALHAVPVACQASFTFWSGGRRPPITLAASDDAARATDGLQFRHGDGPSLQALREHALIAAADLSTETRWPGFAAAALAETPIRSAVSCSLAGGGHPAVALTLYAETTAAFDGLAPELLAAVRGACAMALSAIDQRLRADHLERAMISGRRIGVAVGVLMANRRVSEQEAIDALKAASQRSNRKLRELADDVVLLGDLPDGTVPWH